MNKNKISRYRQEIRMLFTKKQWQKGYSVCLDFLKLLEFYRELNISTDSRDWFFCNIYLSVGSRRLGDIECGINFAQEALTHSSTDGDVMSSYCEMATCYSLLNQTERAIETYDNCITACNNIIRDFDEKLIEERYMVLQCKANCTHNKGEMINCGDLIEESIYLYKELLKININLETTYLKINNAYKTLSKIHKITTTTPLTNVGV